MDGKPCAFFNCGPNRLAISRALRKGTPVPDPGVPSQPHHCGIAARLGRNFFNEFHSSESEGTECQEQPRHRSTQPPRLESLQEKRARRGQPRRWPRHRKP